MEYLLIITTIITLIGVYAVQRPSLNSHFYLGSEREQIFWKETLQVGMVFTTLGTPS